MSPALVTGATGFVGAAVARELIDRGVQVRVLVRDDSDPANIRGLDVERSVGCLTSAIDCKRAVLGCRSVFHVAAKYALHEPDRRAMDDVNVGGTERVLRAAADEGISHIVYTSTVGAVGLPADGSPGDETTPLHRSQLVGHYKRSKFAAERLALRLWREEGVPVKVVNPAAPMGVRDIKPTPTGKLIVDYLNGQMPAYLDTGLNVVDVEDVARGHVLAALRGRAGERYILANQDMTLAEILSLLAEITGLPRPWGRIPYPVALAVGVASELLSFVGAHPPVPLTGVRMARKRMFFSPAKAVRELGLPRTAPRVTLARAVHWFATHGYVRRNADAVAARAAALLERDAG